MGVSRYLPIVIYPKGAPEKAAFIGHRLENFQTRGQAVLDAGSADHGIGRRSTPSRRRSTICARPGSRRGGSASSSRSCRRCRDGAAQRIPRQRDQRRLVHAGAPARAQDTRRSWRSCARLPTGDRFNAGGDRAATVPARPRPELTDALRREEVNRGLTFEYCLIAAGTSHNRAPSEQRWENGDVLSLDSGGNYHGYIGDLARMAILGSRTPNSKTCSARSRRFSARRSSRSRPA